MLLWAKFDVDFYQVVSTFMYFFETIFKLKHIFLSSSQFHQHFLYKFFVQTLFWQLFSSYMYIEKAVETTFIRNICT